MERTLSIIKPDGTSRGLIGEVISRFEKSGIKIAGMKMIPAGKAAILNQTSTIYILLLASLILKEPFGLRKAFAATLSISGVLLVL